MALRHYIALIHKEGASNYGVSFPDLPGVTTSADTIDDALEQAREVLSFAAEDWQALTGSAFPAPRTIDALRTDAGFQSDADGAIVAAVPIRLPAHRTAAE